MPTEQELEMKTGVMIRSMSGDIRDSFREILYKMYGLSLEEAEDLKLQKEVPREKLIASSCAEWHWNIVAYCRDIETIKKYVAIIQYAFQNDILLDENEAWLQIMRIVLPVQFIKKTRLFTQVPQLAMMDRTQLYHKYKTPPRRMLFSDIRMV